MSESEKEAQPEHQAVEIVEEEPEESDENFEEEEFEAEAGAETDEPSGPQQTVVVHKPAEPVKEIQLKPTGEQVDALKKVLKIMKGLDFEEVTFNFNGNLNICAINPSRVAMIVAQVDMGLGFGIVTEAPANIRKFTGNIAEFERALRIYGPTINVKQDEAVFSKDKIEVTVPLVEDSEEQIPEPKTTLDINATIDFGEVFAEMKKYLVELPCYLALEAENGSLTMKSTNEQLQKFKMTGFKCDGNGRAIFSSPLLQSLGSGDYAVSYAKELPLKAQKVITQTTYSNDRDHRSVTSKVASIIVWMAPRIETE